MKRKGEALDRMIGLLLWQVRAYDKVQT